MHSCHSRRAGLCLTSLLSLCLLATLVFLAPSFAEESDPAGSWAGDCNNDYRVDVGELVTGVNIAPGTIGRSGCPAFDDDNSGAVEVHELVGAVDRALNGCGGTAATGVQP